MEDLCLFGFASTHSADGTGYSYKLLGKGATREDYQL